MSNRDHVCIGSLLHKFVRTIRLNQRMFFEHTRSERICLKFKMCENVLPYTFLAVLRVSFSDCPLCEPTQFLSYSFRQLLGNGTLYFPPFLAQDFRAEVHNARYRCRATSSVGTVLSREVTLRAGKLSFHVLSLPKVKA